jgi:hypothetical protein
MIPIWHVVSRQRASWQLDPRSHWIVSGASDVQSSLDASHRQKCPG